MSTRLPAGTVTFLFSDIEGSTELSRQHGAAWGDLRAEHRRLLHEVFAEHGGSVVETEGDSFFVVFGRAAEAVAAAIAAQRALASAATVRVRIGIHTTEPHLHRDGYVGVGVSRSARICAIAHGGQIVLSQATAGIVEDQSVPDFRLRDLGEHRLKDIPQLQRLFQVEAEGLRSDFPPLAATVAAGAVATLLFTDLVGWHRITREIGDDDAVAASVAYHRIVDEHVSANDGHLVERVADHTLSVFSEAERAAVAAAAIRVALHDREWMAGRSKKPTLRAALHSGRLARPVPGEFGSPAIHVFRLCHLADPGQILVSHGTRALLEGRLLDPLRLQDLGERLLPGTDEPDRVYELLGG